MRNQVHLPKFLRDASGTLQAALPHQGVCWPPTARSLSSWRELRDPDSCWPIQSGRRSSDDSTNCTSRQGARAKPPSAWSRKHGREREQIAETLHRRDRERDPGLTPSRASRALRRANADRSRPPILAPTLIVRRAPSLRARARLAASRRWLSRASVGGSEYGENPWVELCARAAFELCEGVRRREGRSVWAVGG
jgi:hypothetical protein